MPASGTEMLIAPLGEDPCGDRRSARSGAEFRAGSGSVTVIVTVLTVCTGCSGVLDPATAV